MPVKPTRLIMRTTLALSVVLLLSACSAGAPAAIPVTPTQPLEPTATATPIPPSPTVSPTEIPPSLTPTAEPSETPPPPTATATPVPLAAESISAWCLPEGASLVYAADPASPPDNARAAEYVNGALEVNNLPYSACVILYTFNAPAPEGLSMNIFDAGQEDPFLTAALTPVEGSPNQAAALVQHSYVVAPPYYDISYEFSLADAAGQEMRRDPVNLHRWKPALCWNGRYPSLKTGLCPLPQDLHPWDPGYLTPMPTFPPSSE